jgi:hypothetical protein
MPRPLYPWERPGTYCIGGHVGPRATLDGCGKSRPPGFDLRTIQPVASRYIDWPIHPSNISYNYSYKISIYIYIYIYTFVCTCEIVQQLCCKEVTWDRGQKTDEICTLSLNIMQETVILYSSNRAHVCCPHLAKSGPIWHYVNLIQSIWMK